MNDIALFENSERIDAANIRLSTQYCDDYVSNDESLIYDDCGKIKEIPNLIYEQLCMKRNKFRNVKIKDSKLVNTAFSGSNFKNVIFHNNAIEGNSFICSNFDEFVISSDCKLIYFANNFSQSYFNKCTFENGIMSSSTWLNSSVNRTTFKDFVIKSCTLEDTVFHKCIFKNVNMSNANLDYMILSECDYQNVTFPFYQFAYIIGAANILRSADNHSIILTANNKEIIVEQYKLAIDDLMLHYYGKHEYFPICNLLCAIGNIDMAKSIIIRGIEHALCDSDFRLIKHFCKLGIYYNLFDYDLTRRVIDLIDNRIISNKEQNENLNNDITQSAEIRMLLYNKAAQKTSLQLEIQTNIDFRNGEYKNKVDQLCADCNMILSNPVFNSDGYSISIDNYCPITIVLTVVGAIADLISISGAIQQYARRISHKRSKNTNKIAKDICKEYQNLMRVDMESRIKATKAEIEKYMCELKSYKGPKYGDTYDNIIDSITQKILGEVDDSIDKDLLILKVE